MVTRMETKTRAYRPATISQKQRQQAQQAERQAINQLYAEVGAILYQWAKARPEQSEDMEATQ
jgi:hypothetical protein